MKLFTISYIIATRNRLALLKITLTKLLENLAENEEVVVVDGNSTDGTREYLQQLYNNGSIHQFVSEPDRNQAHGWNKALLLARGTLIKKIIDDDVYDYQIIRQCVAHLLQHPEIDICISSNLSTDILSPQNIQYASRGNYFRKWVTGEIRCFTFSDVSMIIRRSSLSFLGLYDTQFTMMDWEYALRCTYLQAKVVYYNGCNALTVSTPGNITSGAAAAILKKEEKIGKEKYGYEGDRADISLYSELKIAVGKLINYKGGKRHAPGVASQMPNERALAGIYDKLYQYLEDYNQANSHSVEFSGN